MRTIIAGSRGVSQKQFDEAITHLRWRVSVVLSGDARGVDKMGAHWGACQSIPVEVYPAQWTRDGVLDRSAGFKRNVLMANRGEALFAVWDGESRGTKHMIEEAMKRGLLVQVVEISAKLASS